MFFLITLAFLIWFQFSAAPMPKTEAQFITSCLVAIAYVAGFVDSRIFAKFDASNGNRLMEAEDRYEEHVSHS